MITPDNLLSSDLFSNELSFIRAGSSYCLANPANPVYVQSVTDSYNSAACSKYCENMWLGYHSYFYDDSCRFVMCEINFATLAVSRDY
jgi:hypothetical protein